jgi:methionyl-tRNA formyltransferase
MAIKMETGDRSQYETSERASTGEQQANMATFYSKRTSKDKSIKKISTRKHIRKTRLTNNPLTNIYIRIHKKRSSSRVIKAMVRRYKKADLISQIYKKLGKCRSTSRDKALLEVEEQVIEDRFGDVPK